MPVLLLCSSLSTVAVGKPGDEVITVGFDHWPPYSFKGAPEQGILLPLIQKALSNSDYQTMPRFFPGKRLLYYLMQNKGVEIACNLWRTPEREELFLFSLPILKNHLSFYAVAGHSYRFIELSDLQNYRIGVIKGYAYEYDDIFKKAQLQSPKVTQTNSAEELFKMLTAGRIDLALSDQRVAHWASQHISSVTTFETVGDVFLSKDLHCAVSKKHPKAQQLIEAINSGLGKGDIDNRDGDYQPPSGQTDG